MKKLILVVLMCLVVCQPAEARHYRRHSGWCGGGCYAADVTAGVVGTTAGILLADQIMQKRKPRAPKPRVYVVEPEGKCYTVVSRKTGKITQQCVENASDDIIYVD